MFSLSTLLSLFAPVKTKAATCITVIKSLEKKRIYEACAVTILFNCQDAIAQLSTAVVVWTMIKETLYSIPLS